MRLSLTAPAAPHLSLDALDVACRARGLDGQELVLQPNDELEALPEKVRVSGARIVSLRAAPFVSADADRYARLAAKLDVPLCVPPRLWSAGELRHLGEVFALHGARLLLGHGSELEATLGLLDWLRDAGDPSALGLSWELRPATDPLADAGAVLFAVRERLGLVRLHGGGPEQHDQEGLGLGSLLVELALTGYANPIVLCPSTPEQLPRWRKWLESQKAAGCGSAANTKELFVDVREVEPKDRLDTILGAYRSLVPGATMFLTVDHDPSCMYFMLEATEPAGSFAFQTTEKGPVVWKAQVTRR